MNSQKQLTYGSLFTGIGGFDLGFDRAGMRCLWQVERDKDCNRVLGRQWPDVHRGTDVREVTAGGFPHPDVICGGFPCQDLSVAGNRKGLAGERSGLWHEFHRIIAELGPRIVVIENVPGLFSSNGGLDYFTVLRGLEELGYCVAGALLDSQYFGVPQRRDRVFLVASLGNGSCAEILFESESVRGDSAPGREARESIAGPIGGSSQGGGFRTTDLDNWLSSVFAAALTIKGDEGSVVASTVSARDYKGASDLIAHTRRGGGFDASEDGTGRGTPLVCAPLRTSPYADNASHESQLVAFSCKDHGADAGEVSPTLRSMEFDESHANGGGQVAIAFNWQDSHAFRAEEEQTNPLRCNQTEAVACFKPNQGALARSISYTKELGITLEGAGGGNNKPAIHSGMMVRRLTPRECERLQGFPDDWTRWDAAGKEISDSARYRMLGNAVTVPVVNWIGRQVVKFTH